MNILELAFIGDYELVKMNCESYDFCLHLANKQARYIKV